MKELTEFVRNSTDSEWLPSFPSMGDDDRGEEMQVGGVNIGAVVGGVLAVVVLVVAAILIYCYCRRKQKLIYQSGIEKHAKFRHTVNDPPSVFSVEKETQLRSIQATSVTSDRCLRYSEEPGVSSLPASGRSVSYDYLGDGNGNKAASWDNLRNSVSSDQGFYGSETLGHHVDLHVSASHLSKSVGPVQTRYLDSTDSSPERSLSSDHIQRGQWPPFAQLKGKMGDSLGRDSGLGSSQETCLSYPYQDSKSSLSNYSMLSSDDEYNQYAPAPPARPNSLPRLYPDIPATEIKKVVDIPYRSLMPVKSSLDENENQPDVQKTIQYLRERFYDMRNQRGYRNETDPNSKTFGTTNFTIGIFGAQGGTLQLFDRSASLAIPEGSLPSDQELYLYAFYENVRIDGKSYLRRVIECGPDGLGFKKPVCLSFKPGLIPCDEPGSPVDLDYKVVFKNTEPENWKSLSKEDSFSHAEKDFVTVHVNHFTRFTVVPSGASVVSGPATTGASAINPATFRKFYISVYVGTAAGATTHYKVCFIEKDKDKLKSHNSAMNSDGFRSAVATPKLFNFTPHGGDVFLDIPSLHGCELKGANKRHVISVDEFAEDTVEDLGLPQRDFLLALRQHNSEGLFEVAAYQQKIHDKVLTFCISMNINNVKEKLIGDSGSADLTHRDVMEFLAGFRLAQYRPHVFFPKDMKLDICTNVESSPSKAWMGLAESAQIPGNKYRWIETYVKGKHVTPCYVVLDFIEAKLIAKDISMSAACDQLASMLENSGQEVAADYCLTWKAELLKRTKAKSPQKEKGSRSPQSRFDFGGISPSRDELDTIQEETNFTRDRNSTRLNMCNNSGGGNYKLSQQPNGAIASQTTRQNLVTSAPNNVLSPRLYSKNYDRSDSALSLSSPDNSTPSPLPDSGPFTISSSGESKYNQRRQKTLMKGNREKSGRNDSGIGSEIASPTETDHGRVSHI